jgi:hypothetical protein
MGDIEAWPTHLQKVAKIFLKMLVEKVFQLVKPFLAN